MITTINNEHTELNFSSEREQSQVCLNSAEHEKNQGRKVLNVPNLRFPEFQGEWEEYRIEDITENISSGRCKSHSPNGKYNLYGSTGIIGKTDEACYEGNLVLVARVGANAGSLQIINEPCGITDNTLIIKPKEVDAQYLFFFLQHFNLNRLIFGSGQPLITGGMLKKVKVSLGTVQEQNKLTRLLSFLDERIATQNKIIDKLQSLIKGLNDSLYAQYGGKVLTSFAKLGTSYSGLSGKSAQDFGSGKPFITYLNVYSNNVINENEFQYVAIKDDEKQNVAEYGDVLFTLSSETPEEVGIGSVYLGKEKVYLNSFCFGIHITNTKVAFSPYLSYYVSSTAFRKFIYPYAQGSTRFNLCKADFEKASIKLPTLENKKRIHSIMSHIDSKIETERQMLDLYNSQKQYLLRQMFI